MRKIVLHFWILLLCLVALASCATSFDRETDISAEITKAVEVPVFKTEVPSLEPNVFTTKYGNLNTALKGADLFNAGFEWGDVVRISFLDKELVLPLIPNYACVDAGLPAVVVNKSSSSQPEGNVILAISMGDFTTTYGIAEKTTNPDKSFFWTANEGVEFPLEITIEMEEKGGYLSQYLVRDLSRTNEREDYMHLTDEEFANFRKVLTKNINNLYRTSNPVNSELGRNKYSDKAIEKAQVSIILNLSDSKEDAESRPEFKDSYYSKCKIIYLNLGVDSFSQDFKSGLAQGLRFIADNKGTYAIHCTEGKDRAGFTCALLECLMGASAQEVADDYMTSFYNYYGVEKDTDKYEAILESNIVKILQNTFGVEDFWTADLKKGAESYLKSIGLSDMEINSIRSNLI